MIDFLISNPIVSLISFFFWLLSILFLIKIDIGLMRGRGDYKSKSGKFEPLYKTIIKITFTIILLFISFIFSLTFLANISSPTILPVIIISMLVISLLASFPLQLIEIGGHKAKYLGLWWLIKIIDKYDRERNAQHNSQELNSIVQTSPISSTH